MFTNLVKITTWELMADKQMLKTKFKMLTEVDMKARQSRLLTATVYKDGDAVTSVSGQQLGDAAQWDHIIPETNTETIYKLLKTLKTSKPRSSDASAP